jgi:acetyltransferase-like isoleucine patch superfamily enzyme
MTYALFDEGCQIMAGVIFQCAASCGKNVLVNTGAHIDHDCWIGDHCVISPGAILCGGVTLGEGCAIGAGAIIVQGVTLEPETIVPAGTLVVGQDDMRRPQRVVCGDGAAPPPHGTIYADWPLVSASD